MKRFKEYSIDKKSLYVFDLDETLLHTFSKITVLYKDTNEVARELTNQEFNDYNLKGNEKFDFRQFRDGKIFKDSSIPIQKTIKILKMAFANKYADIVLITFRAPFNINKSDYKSAWKKFGIDLSKFEGVHLLGDDTKKSARPKKSKTVEKYLSSGKYDRIFIYEDSLNNIKDMLSLRKKFPNITFNAILVHGGQMKVITEGLQIDENLETVSNIKSSDKAEAELKNRGVEFDFIDKEKNGFVYMYKGKEVAIYFKSDNTLLIV